MHIDTIATLISALGGEWATADIVDTSVDEVRVWLDRGSIPNGYHYRLDLAARRKGVDVSPCVFGLDNNDLESMQWPKNSTEYLQANGPARVR